MDTEELLKKVRRIEIKTRGLSNNIFAGEYHSAFKGRGMAFSEVREYQYGDDVRDIDWNVTARFDKPYVKVFEEERELTVILMVDVSGSLDFGTAEQTKRQMVTEIAATLAFSAIQNNDKIGVIFFSDRIEKFIPPKKGRKHILFIIRELLDFKPQSRQTDIGDAIVFMTNAIKKRCTVFLISDFFDSKEYTQQLTIMSRRHDVTVLTYVPTSRLREQSSNYSIRTLCLELLRVEDSLQGERADRVFFARAYGALEEPHFLELIDLATRHIERFKQRKRILQEILRERRDHAQLTIETI